MRTFLALAVAILVGFTASSASADMQKDIDNAVSIINEFKADISPAILEKAQGLIVITIGKAGFILSGRGGGGIMVVKTPAGWSAPSSVVVGGAGIGLQVGVQATDFVLVLNSQEAIDAFKKGGNVTLGGDVSVSAGPTGRTGEADVGTTAVSSYSKSKGVFAGISLEGTVLDEGKKTNELFYGRPVTPSEILSGTMPIPASANALYQALPALAPKAEPVTPVKE